MMHDLMAAEITFDLYSAIATIAMEHIGYFNPFTSLQRRWSGAAMLVFFFFEEQVCGERPDKVPVDALYQRLWLPRMDK